MGIHIGTSGWSYDHWENVLYPPDLQPSKRLAHYVARFTTVELNASFYRWHELGDKRAVLLVQLPPGLARDDARLDYFLAAMPPWIRVAVEFRHDSWDHPDGYSLLERHGAGYCIMSGANLPCILRATAPFVYVRLHGPDHQHLYGGSYSDDDLRWWADRIHEWSGSGKDVYVYFNNDGGGNAVRNADTLRWLLG
ncbi:DUF72 domain-containing protein [Paenarthrobacter sp. NPDC056912]|uniref:DUF72 domain-containing protein n=1 Tax=Paenarthrobacter sp. NPDC056912 TaxID=3345965 RepID=UPI00366BAFD7